MIIALTNDEINKLVASLRHFPYFQQPHIFQPRNQLLILLMLDAGLRVGEAVSLHLGDVWFSNSPVNEILVHAENSKTRTSRSIPCTPRLKESIKFFHSESLPAIIFNPENYVFPSRKQGLHLATRQAHRIITCITHAALGKKINPHVLRHTFATRLMQKTNLRVVQELLGHKSLQSTQIYTHPNSNDLRKAIDQL